jgi:hypothetical protein
MNKITTHADWLNEWGTLRACPHFLLACNSLSLFLSPSLFLSLSLSLCLSVSLSLTGEQGAHTLFTGQRERKRERKKEGEREKERGREKEKERGRERERKRERDVEYVQSCYFYFLKEWRVPLPLLVI